MGKSSRKKIKALTKSIAGNAVSKFGQSAHISGLSQKKPSYETKRLEYYLAASVSLLSFLVYLPSLGNGFVNWDDNLYVYENVNIRSINVDFFKWAFLDFSAPGSDYWRPLSYLSHAADYAVWGLNPFGHHLTSTLVHSFNTFFVVVVVIKLLEAYKEANPRDGRSFLDARAILISAGMTGILFGLHPVHVESVAWVSERKDLLCALFFLLSILAYTKYAGLIHNESVHGKLRIRFLKKQYLSALGFFILALLSKPMAISLPVVLMILDWHPFERIHSVKNGWSTFIEKIPFFLLSLLSAILTLRAQKIGGTTIMTEVVPLSTRVLVAVKALVYYLWKMMVPVNLIPYYPYPKDISLLSPEYPLTIILAVGITVLCLVRARKERLWLSLWGYYIVTLMPVLGIIQVGGQSMADRYTYLPSIGPFFMVAVIIAWSWSRVTDLKSRKALVKLFGISVFVALSMAMVHLTFEQIGTWKDSMTLWSYTIEKKPESVIAYNNRGLAFGSIGRFDRAIEDYDKAIALNPSAPFTYNNRGLAFDSIGRFDRAIEDYDKAIALNPSYPDAYNNRGVVFAEMGRFDNAVEDLDKMISLEPTYTPAYNNRGLVFYKMGMSDQAISDFLKACNLGNRDGCRMLQTITRR